MAERDRQTKQDRLLGFARQMRKAPTSGERWLWSHLRDRRCCGVKFFRQRPVGPYVADFLSFEVMLVIELDGAGHERTVEYDRARKRFLEDQGFEVLRIGSEKTFTDGEDIYPFICELVRTKKAQPPPQGEK